jgi:hypothetical protein
LLRRPAAPPVVAAEQTGPRPPSKRKRGRGTGAGPARGRGREYRRPPQCAFSPLAVTSTMFKAIYLSKDDDQFHAELRELDDATLEANTAGADVTVGIEYSTINYKDGLALTNKSPVVRKWPMVPGIDCAGTVVASSSPRWTAGDKVVLNGWGIGETAWGGLAQRGRYRGDWLIRIPAPLSTAARWRSAPRATPRCSRAWRCGTPA